MQRKRRAHHWCTTVERGVGNERASRTEVALALTRPSAHVCGGAARLDSKAGASSRSRTSAMNSRRQSRAAVSMSALPPCLTAAFTAAQPLSRPRLAPRTTLRTSTAVIVARVRHKSRSVPPRHALQAEKWSRVRPEEGKMGGPKPVRHASELRPESCPALVLNADFSPLSYMPLSLWPWQEVVKAVFLDRVTVVETYDVGVRSPSMEFALPSVISLKEYQPVAKRAPAFSRFNVFLRDLFSCQYCGQRFATQELTFDHVIPRFKGGKTNWHNVVTACVRCNHRKGRHLLRELKDMKLRRVPRRPSSFELQMNAKNFPPRYLHHSWRDYVYWSHSMHVDE